MSEAINLKKPSFQELEAENEILHRLYASLLNFGQDSTTPAQRYDFVKARVFDCTVSLNRLRNTTDNNITLSN